MGAHASIKEDTNLPLPTALIYTESGIKFRKLEVNLSSNICYTVFSV